MVPLIVWGVVCLLMTVLCLGAAIGAAIQARKGCRSEWAAVLGALVLLALVFLLAADQLRWID